MELKPGYKLTEVGVIPEDWEIISFGRIASIIDPQPDHRTPPETSGGEPYIGISDFITDTLIDWNGCRKIISKAVDKQQKDFQISHGDIIFGKIGTIGFPKFLPVTPFRYALSANVILIKPKIEPHFLMSWLKSSLVQKQINQELHSTSQAAFGILKMRELLIALPYAEEQRLIATALSDMDELLGALDRLIAKKRDLKHSAMQQLLTGKTRLPEFDGEWEVKRLGDLGHFFKGSGVKKDEAQSGDLPCIRYGEIYTHHHNYIKSFNSWISPEVARIAMPLKPGDILFAGSGETKEEIGKCVAFVDDIKAYAGGDIVILRPFSANAMFLGYYCNTGTINSQKASKGQGDAVVHISANALSSIEIKIPKIPEQTAIATILSDMDAEITALEQRRDKTRALKQGIMQALLTGTTRLVSPEKVYV
jgi:type I restriction enzyme S subunit